MSKETVKSKEVSIVIKQSSPVIEEAKALKIDSPKKMEEAVEVLSKLNKFLDAVVAYKEKKTKPLNELLKVIRGETKPVETMLEEAIEIIRDGMSDYQTEAKRIADEEADKISARVGEGKGHLKMETAVKKMEEIETPDNKVVADTGSVKFKTVEQFEVIDIKLLPIEYHLADEVAIRKQMVAGNKLAGVRYFTKEVPVNTR